MGRQVTIDLATGAGSAAEFLMGKVLVESTAIHFVGDTFVLPDPVELPLFNGKAVHPDMAPSPDGPEPVGAYKFTFTSGITGRAWSEIRGVPGGTANINYKDLPKFQGGPNPPELAPSVEYLVEEALASDQTISDAAVAAVNAAVTNGNYRMPGRFAKVLLTSANVPNFTNLGVMTWDSFRVISGRDYYTVSAGTLDFSANVSASMFTAILLNPATNTLVAVPAQSITSTQASYPLIAVFQNSSRGRSAWMNCPFNFNGAPSTDDAHAVLGMFEIPGANVVPTFVSATVTEIRHQIAGTTVRLDTITQNSTTVVEVRKHLATGLTKTYTTNLTTLATEVS